MHKITKIFSSVCLLILSSLTVGCGDQKDKTPQKEVLVVGTSADNPPFTFYTTEEGARKIQGFEIDLARQVAQEMGVEVAFRDTDFSALIPSLQAGRIDLIMALISPTPERSEKVDFSDIYSRSSPFLLVKKGRSSLKEDDLSGMRIGVQMASTHLELIKEIATRVDDVDFVVMNRVGELVQELLTDRIEGVLVEEGVADSFLKTHPMLSKALLKGHQVEAAAAFPQGSPWRERFDSALSALQEKGAIKALEQKWMPSE